MYQGNPHQRIPLLTLEEYLGLDGASEHKWEFEEGRIYRLAGSTNEHAAIVASLGAALNNALGKRRCRVMIGQKVIAAARKHYYPDLVISCDEREDGDDTVVRYPLLIAEVLSPSTDRRDKGVKLLAYRQVASIENILLLSTQQAAVVVYERDRETPGEWIGHPYDPGQPTMYLASLDFSIQLADLYRRTSLALKSE